MKLRLAYSAVNLTAKEAKVSAEYAKDALHFENYFKVAPKNNHLHIHSI